MDKILLCCLIFAILFWLCFVVRCSMEKRWKMVYSWSAILAVTCCFFAIKSFAIVHGRYPFGYASILQGLAILPVIPLIHAYIMYVFTDESPGKRDVQMLCVGLICLPQLMVELINPDLSYPSRRVYVNSIFLSMDGVHGISITLLGMALAIQSVWIIHRIYGLWLRVHYRRVVLPYRLKSFFYLSVVTFCGIIIFSIFSSFAWYRANAYLAEVIFFTLLFACWMVVLPFVSGGVELYDTDNNPVKIDNDPMTAIAFGLNYLLDKDKIYLKSTLRLEDVAQMLGTNRTYLSQAIHMVYNSSFPDLLAKYRLKEALELMKSDPGVRITDVARRSGFNSSSTLAKVCRDATGLTPMEWKKENCKGVIPEKKTRPKPVMEIVK